MLSYLLSNPIAMAIIFMSLAWAWLNFKNFISWWKIDKLTKEQKTAKDKIDSIPDDVKKQSIKDNLDFWNKQ